jgi:hypothetical protein
MGTPNRKDGPTISCSGSQKATPAEESVGHTKMMNKKPYRVYVVVDTHYGERLRDLSADEPIWIIDSEENHSVIQTLWNERKGSSHLDGITSFKYDSKGNPEDWFVNELATIDLHHGEFSHDPPYSVLEVIGVAWSDKIEKALRGYGFIKYEQTTKGFTARREIGQPVNQGDGE